MSHLGMTHNLSRFQLVWRGSTELGIGIASNRTNVYVVGRYRSAGNFRGRERENIGIKGGTPYKIEKTLEEDPEPESDENQVEPEEAGDESEANLDTKPNKKPLSPLDEARELALEIHNKLRAKHDNTPPMKLADDLNQQVNLNLSRDQ